MDASLWDMVFGEANISPMEQQRKQQLAQAAALRGQGPMPAQPQPQPMPQPANQGMGMDSMGQPPQVPPPQFNMPPQAPQQRQATLPRATGQQAPVAPPGAPGAPSLDSRRAEAQARMDAAQTAEQAAYAPPDYSKLEAEGKARGQQGGQQLLMSLAAMEAGKDFAPMQAHFLKQSAESMQPMKVQGGTVTDRGFVADPGYAQELDVKRAEAKLRQADVLMQRVTTEEDRRAAAALAQEGRMELQRANAEMRRGIAGITAGMQGNDKAVYEGVTPDTGERIVTGRDGALFKVTKGPNGQSQQVPYFGPVIPKATVEKNVASASEFLSQADAAAASLKELKKANPNDFGWKAGVQAATPGFLKGTVSEGLGISQQGADLAATLRTDAAQRISDMYGAAQSAGEASRAKGFIPAADDDLPTLINKLGAAERYARDKAARSGSVASGIAGVRTGIPNTGSVSASIDAANPNEGRTATGAGGEKIKMINGKWVPQ